MSNAKIAGRKPTKVSLEAGEHHWCACYVLAIELTPTLTIGK